jgi:NAD(P)-dependent dehydrogenase (short-subunit alcohol dehydrogenase family)
MGRHSANSGIGKEIATYAAAKGATVYMICRSKDRALQAQEDIVQATSTNQVKVLLVRNLYVCMLLLLLLLCGMPLGDFVP